MSPYQHEKLHWWIGVLTGPRFNRANAVLGTAYRLHGEEHGWVGGNQHNAPV